MGWAEFSHAHCGIDTFGASAPAGQVRRRSSFPSPSPAPALFTDPLVVAVIVQVYKKFGLTGEDVAKRAQKAIDYFKGLGHPVYSPLSHQLAL